MALFDVSGWDLDNKVVLGGDKKAKQSNRAKKRERKRVRENAPPVVDEISEEPAPLDAGNAHEQDDAETKTKRRKNSENGESQKTSAIVRQKDTTDSTTESIASNETIANPAVKLTPLQQKMMAKLSGSRFRWINEQLYTTSSEEAFKMLQQQPALFKEYHDGFRSQVQGWPENPVDVFVEQIMARATTRPVNAPGGLPGFADKKVVIADMGCGEAQLALDVDTQVKAYMKKTNDKKGKGATVRNGPPRTLNIKVHSFDLHAYNSRITVADIKRVPLPAQLCNIVIFCLALMGTNFLDFVAEAQRLLAPNGELWIAEIKSRFSESADARASGKIPVGHEFEESLKLLGFIHKKTDNENKMFTRFEFFKPSRAIEQERAAKMERRGKFIEQKSSRETMEERRAKTPEGKWLLKPCLYKRR